ncbi:hypothetical protein [Nonomuraea angiospora]|uniref:hypothetical protein n=1 Tax=Nonomuraea angiospora TaxID=46172 RepID=UPI0029AA5FF5|nr:hypothetical protein [Nonomuraea angiospora]MDX3107225.1 hypothetical protein [Nonomuraea angiospora]
MDVCGAGSVAAQPYKLPSETTGGLERVENMLLTFPQPLTVSEHYNLGRFGEVTLSSQGPAVPADRPAGRRRGAGRPPLAARRRLHQPTEPIGYKNANPRPPKPFPVIGNVKVASFNTLNWFTTPGSRGATDAEEQRRRLAKLVAALKGLDADAVALMEVENNGQTAPRTLVDPLNAEVGAGTYPHGRRPAVHDAGQPPQVQGHLPGRRPRRPRRCATATCATAWPASSTTPWSDGSCSSG